MLSLSQMYLSFSVRLSCKRNAFIIYQHRRHDQLFYPPSMTYHYTPPHQHCYIHAFAHIYVRCFLRYPEVAVDPEVAGETSHSEISRQEANHSQHEPEDPVEGDSPHTAFPSFSRVVPPGRRASVDSSSKSKPLGPGTTIRRKRSKTLLDEIKAMAAQHQHDEGSAPAEDIDDSALSKTPTKKRSHRKQKGHSLPSRKRRHRHQILISFHVGVTLLP